jgi:hypothetical protein
MPDIIKYIQYITDNLNTQLSDRNDQQNVLEKQDYYRLLHTKDIERTINLHLYLNSP